MKKSSRTLKRREFLTTSLATATAGIAGFSGTTLADQRQNVDKEKEAKESGPMIFREIGKTGIRVPIVSMGVMNAFNPQLVKYAYNQGIRFFDTAAVYQNGYNEKMVGNVIKELGIRDKIAIQTKIFLPKPRRNESPDKIKEFFLKTAEESLKRLQTDHVDILLSHNVPDTEYLNNPGVIEALQQLKDQKKTRFIGFSTHSNMAKIIQNASMGGLYDVIETAFNYSMFSRSDLMDACKAAAGKGIGIVAMKTQCQQPWYKSNEPGNRQLFYEGPIIHSALLKWVLKHPFISCAIPGFTSFEQIDEDITVALNLDYTDEEKKFLQNRGVKLAMTAVCQQCGACLNTCPRKADIPELIRIHMYAVSYNNFHVARETLDALPEESGLVQCGNCSSCSAVCRNRVNIPERISELKLIYG
jgi:predicted aldo/keto reductase-like oxidoreductase